MGMFLDLPFSEVIEEEEAPSLTYKLDLNKGRISGMVDGLEAVKQAIRKAIITPRFRCLIYDNQYGSEIETAYLESDASSDFIEMTCEDFITDTLKPDTRIIRCRDFAFEFRDDHAHISFTADTIFGETEIREVI